MILQETVPASFAGVDFLVLKSSITGGRKDVVKEFPNSNRQLIEDLGLKPRSYTLEAVIHASGEGDSYIQLRDDFLQVLESGVTDILVHPLYGPINNIAVRTFTLNEDFTALGEARFSLVFAINDSQGTPTVSGDTISLVLEKTDLSIQALTEDVAENFGISSQFPSNFTAAVDKVNSVVDTFNSTTSFLQVAADQINVFSSQVSEMSEKVTQLVSQPQALADSITGIFQTVNGLYSSVDATFSVLQGFFDFGDSDVSIVQDTVSKTERAKNNSLINNMVKSEALVLAYSNAAQIDYSTVTEIQRVGEILEEQYQKIVVNSVRGIPLNPNSESPLPNELDSTTVDTVTDLRIELQRFFDDQKLNASQIISVNTTETSSRVLAYQYYGDSSLGDSIAELNENLNVTFLKGDVEIFTE